MLATLVVAVSLALARLTPLFKNANETWGFWGIASTAACVISAVSLLPAGVLLLRKRALSRSLVWSSLYVLALIGLVWIAVALKFWLAPGMLLPRAVYVGFQLHFHICRHARARRRNRPRPRLPAHQPPNFLSLRDLGGGAAF